MNVTAFVVDKILSKSCAEVEAALNGVMAVCAAYLECAAYNACRQASLSAEHVQCLLV